MLANQRRARRRRAALVERLALAESVHKPSSDPEDHLVHEALGRLGRLDREVLLLSEWEGLSPAAIASVLNCPKVTARSRLHRARRRFRSAFERLAAAEEAGRRSSPALEAATTSITHALRGDS
jgi:RNA polymerase sigma-70 factor (ECF subfamily)